MSVIPEFCGDQSRELILDDDPLVLGLLDGFLILKGSNPSFPADEVSEVGFVCKDCADRCEIPFVGVFRIRTSCPLRLIRCRCDDLSVRS